MTDRTPETLVCIYYRVAAHDSRRVIAAVREFQRTLGVSNCVDTAEVLLRSDHFTAPPPDAPAPSHPSPEPPAGDPGADATVMETYRLRLPDAALRAFLATLETAARPHAGLLRGARHVELFVPCV